MEKILLRRLLFWRGKNEWHSLGDDESIGALLNHKLFDLLSPLGSIGIWMRLNLSLYNLDPSDSFSNLCVVSAAVVEVKVEYKHRLPGFRASFRMVSNCHGRIVPSQNAYHQKHQCNCKYGKFLHLIPHCSPTAPDYPERSKVSIVGEAGLMANFPEHSRLVSGGRFSKIGGVKDQEQVDAEDPKDEKPKRFRFILDEGFTEIDERLSGHLLFLPWKIFSPLIRWGTVGGIWFAAWSIPTSFAVVFLHPLTDTAIGLVCWLLILLVWLFNTSLSVLCIQMFRQGIRQKSIDVEVVAYGLGAVLAILTIPFMIIMEERAKQDVPPDSVPPSIEETAPAP